jgi:hypothetical protein
MSWRSLAGRGLLLIVLAGRAAPASAQDGVDEPREVEVGFDLGEYVGGDWTVDAVVVEGDLDEGQDVTVQILGTSGRVLWQGTLPFTKPSLRIPLDQRVLVGDVESAGISQALTIVDTLLVEPDINAPVSGGGGGAGQIATTMVLVIIIAVILFRTPLPSASSQRWTK